MIKTFSLDRFAETRLLFFGPMAKLPPTLDQHTLRKALKLLNVVNVAPTGLFNKKNKLNFLSFHKNLIGILVKGFISLSLSLKEIWNLNLGMNTRNGFPLLLSYITKPTVNGLSSQVSSAFI